jgi:hypothetical protein
MLNTGYGAFGPGVGTEFGYLFLVLPTFLRLKQTDPRNSTGFTLPLIFCTSDYRTLLKGKVNNKAKLSAQQAVEAYSLHSLLRG